MRTLGASAILVASLVACTSSTEGDTDGVSSSAVNVVACGAPSAGTSYVHGVPAGELVLFQVGGQPMESRMVRGFRRLMAVHPPLAISTDGATVFRTIDVQKALVDNPRTSARAATPGWSNHQNGHAVDLMTTSLPRLPSGKVDEAKLACFGFARPYAMVGTTVAPTAFGVIARRRYADGSAPPGKTIDDVRAQVAKEDWHYEFDEELAADILAAELSEPDPSKRPCAKLHERATVLLGGDGSCEATPDDSTRGCDARSLGRAVHDDACVYKASVKQWNRCNAGTFAVGITRDACGAVPCVSLDDASRRCPLTADGFATDVATDDPAAALCAREGTFFPSSDSRGAGAGHDWKCVASGCAVGAKHCWQ